MTIIQGVYPVLHADDGKFLCNGRYAATTIVIFEPDRIEDWYEIDKADGEDYIR